MTWTVSQQTVKGLKKEKGKNKTVFNSFEMFCGNIFQ